MKRSTIGWQVCCQFKDGSTSWENLADLKESHPLETAEYAVTHCIDHESAFNWWVPHVLKKHDRIISLVFKWTTCYLKRTHKFGIEVPKTVKEALALDRKNSNTLWADAIAKEMKAVCIAFNILPDGHSVPIGDIHENGRLSTKSQTSGWWPSDQSPSDHHLCQCGVT